MEAVSDRPYERIEIMAIKLIALDVDGTLLTSDQKITPATAEALNKAKARGIHIVLSTGRLAVECRNIFEQLPCIQYINGCTGAEVTDLQTGRSVAGSRIPGDEARRLYNILKDLDLMLCAFDPVDGKPHCSKELWDRCREVCSPEVAWHLSTFYHPEDDFEGYLSKVDCLIKYYMPCFTPEAMTQVAQRLKDEPYTVLQCGPADMEIMPVGADKAVGLRKLAESLGLTAAEVMAIGDSENDVSMLRYAGLSVCMANGSEQAKAAAGYITDDNNHDGVAKAVNMVLEGAL